MMPEQLDWDRDEDWLEIKAAWMRWYARCQAWEATKQNAMLSWGRTMTLCAGLCLIAVFIEVEYSQRVYFSQTWSCFRKYYSSFQMPQPNPSSNKLILATNRSPQEQMVEPAANE